jgi:hypothetical protein
VAIEREGTVAAANKLAGTPTILLLAGATTLAAYEAPPPSPSPRVRIRRAADAAAVTKAVRGAARRLEKDDCRRIFTDFNDTSGRPLQDGLDRLGVTGSAYLHLIGFYDGSAERPCERSTIVAFTTPGHRTVFVCPRFTRGQLSEPATAEFLVIHEALHTLGLGENPPLSTEITHRVASRCRRER